MTGRETTREGKADNFRKILEIEFGSQRSANHSSRQAGASKISAGAIVEKFT